MSEIVLAADLGGTNMRMAAVSADGEILGRVKLKTPVHGNRGEIVDLFVSAVLQIRESVKREPKMLALAVPGTVNVKNGVVARAPNIPELDDFDIAGAVSGKTGMPVMIENDANAAAIGENWLGASADSLNSIMVTLGTGVGGGIIIDGKIVRGLDGTAGEIGHINVEPEGFPCGCGSRGCVEQYASASAITRLAGIAAQKFKHEFIGLPRPFDSKDIYDLAINGGERAKEIFETQGYYLGIALAGLINSLNPEVIVIGGGAAAGWDAFFPSLQKEIDSRTYAAAAARAKIVRAKLQDNAGILGAARLAFDSLTPA